MGASSLLHQIHHFVKYLRRQKLINETALVSNQTAITPKLLSSGPPDHYAKFVELKTILDVWQPLPEDIQGTPIAIALQREGIDYA